MWPDPPGAALASSGPPQRPTWTWANPDAAELALVCNGLTMAGFGVLLPSREAAISGERDVKGLFELVRAARDGGLDSVWAGDSLTARPRPEPLTLLAGIAAACDDLVIGTAALTGALRHPILAAHSIATLDQVAEGRLVLGLGAGFPYPETQAEFEVAGARFDQRVGRLLEVVRLWRILWDPDRDLEAPLSFSGKYESFEGIGSLTLPARPGGPPLWLAGAGEKALRDAGRHFDGWLPYVPEASQYAHSLGVVRDAMPDDPVSSHPFTPALYVTVNVQADPRSARAELASYIQDYYGLPLEIMETLQASFAGRADWCVEWLRDFITAGAEHVVFRIGSFDWRPQLEQIVEVIVPGLRDRTGPREGG